MHYWLEKRNPKRKKGKKMHSKTGNGRHLGPKTDGRIGAPDPPLEGSPASPH